MKKLTYILLFICAVVFGQQEPDASLINEGIMTSFPSQDYDPPEHTDPVFTTTYYIDPVNGSSSNDGLSEGSPKKSIWDLASNEIISNSNTAFLWKRGTQDNQGSRKVTFTGDNIILGAYDFGNRPRLTLYVFGMESNNFTIREMHFFNTTMTTASQQVGYSGGWIYDCEIERQLGWGGSALGGVLIFGSDVKFIRNIVRGSYTDGVFCKGVANGGKNIEIAYNHIYNVNRTYFDGNYPEGDCIQFSTFDSCYVHHNLLRRDDTPNKFCIILRDEASYWAKPLVSLIEYNVFYGPADGYGGASIYYEEEHDGILRWNQFKDDHSTNRSELYIADTEGSVEVYGNVFSGGSTPFYSFTANKIYNNTWYNSTKVATDDGDATIKNNIFTKYESRFESDNLFVDTEGAGNLFEDAPNFNFKPLINSPSRNSAEWDAGFDSDFDQDLYGVTITQQTNQFDIGGQQYESTNPCVGINIYFNGIVISDTANKSVGEILQTITGNGQSPYIFSWNDGNANEDRTGLAAGQYTVTIADDNGCTNDTVYTVNNYTSIEDGNIKVDSATTSNGFQNPPDNLIDNNLNSSYNTNIYAAEVVFHINDTVNLDSIIVFPQNYSRANWFAIQAYRHGVWTTIVNCTTTVGLQSEAFHIDTDVEAIKAIFYANDEGNGWSSYLEFDFYGSQYSAPILPPSNIWKDALDHWWMFEGNTIDSIGSNDGTPTNITYVSGPQSPGDSAIYTPNNGYVVISDLNFGISEEWTLSWWMYPTTTYKTIASYDGNNEILFSGNRIRFDNTGTHFDFDHNVPLNEWHMITLVARSNNYISMWFDTVKVDSVLLTDNALRLTHIGGTSLQLDGYQDDWRVAHNTAFNEEGVKSMYNDFPELTSPCDTTTININSVVTDVACYGESTGAIDITVSGGIGPYAYLWNDGATTQDLTDIIAGVYSVTVTDTNGCFGVKSFTITQPDSALSLETEIHAVDSCFGDNQNSVTIIPKGGTSPYTVYWPDIDVTANRIDTLRANTSYNVRITDDNGCVLNTNWLIGTIVGPINTNATIVDDRNDDNLGSILVLTTGGSSPYTYLWSNGETTESIDSLSAGEYSVIITDDNDCVAYDTFIVDNHNDLPSIIAPSYHQQFIVRNGYIINPIYTEEEVCNSSVCEVIDFDGIDDVVSDTSINLIGDKKITFSVYLEKEDYGLTHNVLIADEGLGFLDLVTISLLDQYLTFYTQGANSRFVSLSGYSGQILNVEMIKSSSDIEGIIINGIPQDISITRGVGGAVTGFSIGGSYNEDQYYLSDAYIWDIKIYDDPLGSNTLIHHWSGNPNGNLNSAWEDKVNNVDLNVHGNPTITDIP